jgi:hypothetical protein
MRSSCSAALVAALISLVVLSGCGSGDGSASNTGGGAASGGKSGAGGKATGGSASGGSSSSGAQGGGTTTDPEGLPAAGYADGHAEVPAEGRAEDVSAPTSVIGTGTPESCQGDDFVAAVAKGGVITFDCGDAPTTIVLDEPAKVFNDRGTKLVIDGGGKVTLSGGGKTRILYMSTCDEAQVYPPGSGDCQNPLSRSAIRGTSVSAWVFRYARGPWRWPSPPAAEKGSARGSQEELQAPGE